MMIFSLKTLYFMKISLLDIAKQLNVSTAAVSRALNDLPGVGDELRLQVKETAARLGYVKHLRVAAGGRPERVKQLIVVLFGPIGGNLVGELDVGIDEILRRKGYYELRYLVDTLRLHRTEAGKEAFLLKTITETSVAGILSCYVPLSDVIISKMYKHNVPVVLIENQTEFGRCVTTNNVKASHKAVTKLIELGRRHIGCVMPPEDADHVWYDRLSGYRRALKEKAYPYDPSLIVYENFVSIKSGGLATRALLQQNPKLDAILYGSDTMACGGMKMLRDLGKKVPDEIAIIGFDDEDFDSVLQPTLSSIRQPIRKMAEVGLGLLFDSIDKGDYSHRHIEMETELLLRGSCLKDYDGETWA